ncbi:MULTISPECIES: hypothetical protein [unclassified Streptomyces]|uniref:hypothetical protein n=1 Tax=unclassified Streptomyces TaxID=2593676 RepID=UPI000F01D07D|nr:MULTISPECIES: hypothetical protein [unclassified Streptomyces]MDQ0403005.1 anti-sigma-K factor RskA [Streptomyces sp. DSM 40167]
MSAPTYTRPPRATRGGVDSRLPWWALALPVLAFVTLLLLILNPADAQAATEQPAIAHLLERLLQLTVG